VERSGARLDEREAVGAGDSGTRIHVRTEQYSFDFLAVLRIGGVESAVSRDEPRIPVTATDGTPPAVGAVDGVEGR
jgi:hypothetical protein